MSGETVNAQTNLMNEGAKASFVTAKWNDWDGIRDPAITRWKEVEAYRYATDTSSLPNSASAFTHSTHIPLVAPVAQDLEAIILQVVMPHEDWFSFEPADSAEARTEQRKAVTSYIKNRHSLSKFANTVAKLRSDYITYGNCFAQVTYVNEATEEKAGYVGPRVQRVSPYDIVFDPTANSFEQAPKIIREIISLGELKRRGINGTFNDSVVNDLLKQRSLSSSTDAGDDKNEQYTPRGFGTYQQYLTSGFIELLWFYGDIYDPETGELLLNRKIISADSNTLLLDEEIDTVTGKPHIFHAGWQTLPDNLWAMGPLDSIIGLNYQMNHRENAKSEALDRLIYPDKVYIGDVEETYDEETGQVTYIAPEGGGVNELAVNTQFFSFDLHIDRLIQSGRSAARLPSDITGFRSQGEKTLGEVTALTEGGMRGFIDKAADFERNVLEPIIMAELELAHANFGDAIKVPNKSEGGFIETLSISKEDLAVNGLLIAKGAKRFARKNQLLASLTQVSATPLFQLAMTHFSGKGSANLIAELLEVQDMGLVEEFAQITEQGEAQQLANSVEQQTALATSQPSLEEETINQQLQGLDSE